MSEYVIQGQTLTGIADAIREQLGTQQQYTPESMAAAIGSIQGGGDTTFEDQFLSGTLTGISNNRVTTLANYRLYQDSSILSVSMAALTEIGAYCFYQCVVEYGYFPKVKNILNNCFIGGAKWKILYFASLESVGASSFTNFGNFSTTVSVILAGNVVPTLAGRILNFRGTFYVTDSLIEEYKSATNWSEYSSKIKGLSEIPAEVQQWLDQQGGASA